MEERAWFVHLEEMVPHYVGVFVAVLLEQAVEVPVDAVEALAGVGIGPFVLRLDARPYGVGFVVAVLFADEVKGDHQVFDRILGCTAFHTRT